MSNTITSKIKKVTFWVVFLQVVLIGTISLAQQTNNWYFGSAGCFPNTGMRINFGPGGPYVTTGYPLMTEEGSSSISDASGNPLFYTDGTDVWEAAGNTKFNTYALGGGASSSQSAIILPKPGNANEWLLFTVSVNGNNGASYVTVRRTGTTFSVVEAARVSLVGAGIIGEGLCVVGSTKASSAYWVIMRDRGTTGQIRAFEVTSAGAVITTPVLSTMSGSGFTNTNYDQYIGIIKSNTCQTKLAFTYYNNHADIAHFNPATGQLRPGSARRILNPTSGGLGHSYGLEFSQNDRYLYLTALDEGRIYQYDTAAFVSYNVSTVSGEAGQLQLAPDGNIYMARMTGNCPGTSYLASISNANTASPTFNPTAILLSGVTNGSGNNGGSYRGLPTFTKSLIAQSLFAQPGDGNYCVNTNIPLSYTFGGYVASNTWTITPGTAGVNWTYVSGNNTSAAPTIRFLTTGTYTVTATITDNCGNIYTAPMVFNITNPKVPAGKIDCNTGSITLTATGSVPADYPNYVWYDAASGGNVIGTGSPVTLSYADIANTPTSVWVEVGGSVTTTSSGSGSIGMTSFTWGNNAATYGPVPFTILASSLTLQSFQVQAGTNGGSNFDVEIRNSSNTVVFTKTYTSAANNVTTTVNINTTFPAGSYTITLKNTTVAWRGSTWAGGTNANQISVPTYGTAGTYAIANYVYTYSNYSVTTTCSNRIKVDRHCMTISPGDGTYCMNTNITLGYTLEGAVAPTQTWTITPGTIGTDWTYTSGTSASAAPVVQFLTAGTYTVTVSVVNSGITYTKSETFTITPAKTPAGTISCDNSTNSLTFTATGTPTSDYPNYVWYSAATGGTVLGTGASVTKTYATPAAAPSSVWVEVATSVTIGSSGSNSIGPTVAGLGWSGGNFSTSQTLNVIASSVTLNSFQVKLRDGVSYGGTATVTIRDASNAVVFTQTYTIAGATPAPTYTLNLNTTLPAGNYTIAIVPSASVNWMAYFSWPGATNAGELSLGSANSVLANLQYSFSNTTIVSSSCPVRVKVDRLCSLPVTLLNFTGTNEGTKNILTWTTGSEINNDYFEVQRSSDGINFVTLGIVRGHGNSAVVNDYQFIDYSPVSGINYYRLIQSDYDGTKTPTPSIKIFNGYTNATSFVVSPNPSTSSFGISFLELSGGEIMVMDVLGKVLVNLPIAAGTDKIELGTDFAKGAYVIRFSGATGIASQLVIKE